MSGRLVLLRHGQSYGNVERRLDTLPPGTALTPLGRDQARAFARSGCRRPALLAHSVAIRAYQTAAVVAAELDMVAHEVAGIHEVQVGELENRNDDEAVAEFNATYSRWHRGELDVPLPGARPPTTSWIVICRCSPTCACVTSTTVTGTATSSS